MNLEQFPNLDQFFGGYFHQDWDLEDTDAEAVLNRFLLEAKSSTVEQVCQEIDKLLAIKFDEKELSNILIYDLGCCYNPEFQKMSNRKWLDWLQSYLKKMLQVTVKIG
ncbi:contact-dependent growth inhibition system immunity protein [Kamptonema sp. UHCC 0994]|uniref:contact-dependent growth inhibition system immunity protein n=1 Tax=Kamptonema sp. UHCC 0994 TaxID=3031329 RepID=UPI0023B93BA0|nr:contact-dependent growth inhibition system immunity protein [Kamptonema sp. UHCC 0994]MDF0553645.1 contact-dependent growth inhibition system immunity protein [Kamptonema sp. UHCC 0994]